MKWFKKDVTVKCRSLTELGKLLDWFRQQYGLTGMSMNRFTVTAVMGSQLGQFPKEVLYFEVSIPYHMYATLREQYLKENSLNDLLLQERVFKQTTS